MLAENEGPGHRQYPIVISSPLMKKVVPNIIENAYICTCIRILLAVIQSPLSAHFA